MRHPKVSIIICTYNGRDYDNLIGRCLDSIEMQDYPKDKVEIICVDGGSTDSTLAYLKNMQFEGGYLDLKLIYNPKKIPEGEGNGKWLGYRNISPDSEFIAILDQDNEVQGKNWLKDMLEPLISNPKIFGSACRLMVSSEDPMINRYISLIGTDPFAAYRSLDGLLGFGKIKGGYYEMNKDNMIITGGNCFIYRRRVLDELGGYTQDTDIIQAIAEKGGMLAIPKNAKTWHHATDSVSEFLKKKARWGKNPVSKKFKWIPDDAKGRWRLFLNIICNLTVVPNIYKSIKYYIRDREPAWFMHPGMAFLVTSIYGWNFLKEKINGAV